MFDDSPALLFMFSSSTTAQGKRVVEAVAAEIVEEDRLAASGAYERHWAGSEDELESLLGTLGFSTFDQQGILAFLRRGREIALKLQIDRAEVEKADFAEQRDRLGLDRV